MECQEVKKLLVPFLESDLPEADRVIVEAHLRTCVDCQKERMLHEKTWSALNGLKAPQVSQNFTANVLTRILEQNQARSRSTFDLSNTDNKVILGISLMVIVSLCVLGGSYLLIQNRPFQEIQAAKLVMPEQGTNVNARESVPEASSVNVAQVAAMQPKNDMQAVVKRPVSDEEIIRNLDAFQNSELYKNLPLLSDLDVVQNIYAKGPAI